MEIKTDSAQDLIMERGLTGNALSEQWKSQQEKNKQQKNLFTNMRLNCNH